MSPATCNRVTLTISVSEVLYDALLVSADIQETTVTDVVASALRQSEIAFFAETEWDEVVVLEVLTPPPPSERPLASDVVPGICWFGSVQQAILDHLPDAPTSPGSGVYDLHEVRKTMQHSHHGPAVSRAVRQLIRRRVIEVVAPTGNNQFQRADSRESRVRFVRVTGR